MPNKLIAFLAQPAFCTLVQILCSYFNSGLKKIKISFYLIFIALTLKGRNEALWSECVSRTSVKYSFGCKKTGDLNHKILLYFCILSMEYGYSVMEFLPHLSQSLIFSKERKLQKAVLLKTMRMLMALKKFIPQAWAGPPEDFCILRRWILTLFVGHALVTGACHSTDSSWNSGRFCMLHLWGKTLHRVLKRNPKIFHIGHSFMQYWGFLMYKFFIALDHTQLINQIKR